jgi:large subunit ribosomal protein L17
MRHHNRNKKLGRTRNQRLALLQSLARSLIIHGKVKTTETRAKALRPFIERLITTSRKDTLAARRLIEQRLSGESQVVQKLFSKLAPRYQGRAGGYTRIIKMPRQGTDARTAAQIELVE